MATASKILVIVVARVLFEMGRDHLWLVSILTMAWVLI